MAKSIKAVAGIKGKFTEEDLDKYLTSTFAESVSKFNQACGKSMHTATGALAGFTLIVNEAKRVVEENLECIKAWQENNGKERLDGYVDSLWCMTQLQTLMSDFQDKFGEVSPDVLKQFSIDYDLIPLQVVGNLHSVALTMAHGEVLNPKRIMLACELIAANNTQKYTTNYNDALDWLDNNLEEDVTLKEYDVNGIKHYCLKRGEDDKVMKPYNFKAVNLQVGE